MSKHRQFNKLLLKIMRITCYQLFLTILCTSLGYAIDTRGQELLERKISVQVANQEIGRALERIETHVGVSARLIAETLDDDLLRCAEAIAKKLSEEERSTGGGELEAKQRRVRSNDAVALPELEVSED